MNHINNVRPARDQKRVSQPGKPTVCQRSNKKRVHKRPVQIFVGMALSRLRSAFHKHRLIGNVIVYTGLFSGADALCQKIQKSGTDGAGTRAFDYARTSRMAIMGCCFYGPFSHYCYLLMDTVLPGNAVRTVVAKCLIDQLGVTVFTLGCFFVGMSLLEGKTLEGVKYELRTKYPATYVSSLLVWPAAQAINFGLVPPAYRVVYISTVAFFWTVFMSYIKSKKETPGFLRFVDRITAAEKTD